MKDSFGDKKLKSVYRQYNRRYFDGKCPAGITVKFARFDGDNRDAMGRMRLWECDDDSIVPSIEIGKKWATYGALVRLTLLHEMAHVFLYTWREIGKRSDRALHHGKRFQAKMRELAAAGAFDGLW